MIGASWSLLVFILVLIVHPLKHQAAAADALVQTSAPVYVDNGSGFRLVRPGAPVSLDGRVMAASELAVLSDASGCMVSLTPGAMVAMNGASLCAVSMRAAAQSTQLAQQSDPNGWIWMPVAGGVLAAFILLPDGSTKKVSH